MRYKYTIEDFVVSERLKEGVIVPEGKFRVLLLEKKGRETLEVLQRLQRRWRLPSRAIGIAGIKDTHAHTFQYMSVPAHVKDLPQEKDVILRFVGYCHEPLSAQDLLSNEFVLVIRQVSEEEKTLLERRLEFLQHCGMPNYFDDQRFGSYEEGEWVGKNLFLGRMERVLCSYIRTHAPKKLQERLSRSWGDWKRCLVLSETHSWKVGVRVFSFLAKEGHEKGFRHAVGLLDHRYLLLVANAYLSFLFNRGLSLRLEGKKGVYLSSKEGSLFFPTEEVTFSEREGWIVAYDVPVLDPYMERVLIEEGVSLSDLKVRGIYGVTVHAKKRDFWVYPHILRSEWSEDECFPGFWRFSLELSLPPGSYATLVLKFLCHGS
ncbi:MAG: tRNA pseudouridine(13) synthase TruD [Brevinematales bacterium]|nr:tRNA pseudouridine(13) synthase TruD [Brevinematales bacterium]